MSARAQLARLFEPRTVWSMAVYAQDAPYVPGQTLGAPRKLFDSKRLRSSSNNPHTQADPFLFVKNDALFVFYEVAYPHGVGKIAAFRTSDLVEFESLGIVLERPFHLSFPFVFDSDERVYMVPESIAANEVALYEFMDFPFGVRKVRTLISGRFVDSHLLQKDEGWYLFTTTNGELHVFVSTDLLTGEFRPHPCNPLTNDLRISRSGGATLTLGSRLYRVAQDCAVTYGANASLIEITELSPTRYQECVVADQLFDRSDHWNARGAHHFATAEHLGKCVIAADGKQNDYFVNRFLGPVRRLIERVTNYP